ncbi:MAG TPA: SDR family oxidoreductase [bacterium]|nr:SDR family oxidoreductase [bacterium]
MQVDLSGRVAVVSGASAGIGRAIAQGFAEAGADVVIGSRREDVIARAADEIAGATRRTAVPVVADVATAAGVDRLLEAAQTRFGRLDILVANAGGPPAGSGLALTDAQWDQAYNQNLMSAVRLIRGAVPLMRANTWGRILTVITSGVKVPIPQLVLSNVFRSGVVAFTKTLSFELAPHNILVNNLAPGRIDTDRVRWLDGVRAKDTGKPVEAIVQESVAGIPLGRYGEPREFAALAVFLASEAASYITGQTICIDGGQTRAMM